ncbi:Hypothetical predicted protein [Cloeon dipterum]|uniref:Uncharacterized protein n=1 Tax=Cloeon dipterum TaxID=197152 RepID=A0A8S1DW04_9INSE|nr:Hypothetical predicted protein [Cloeon dipterum]
MLEMYLSGVVWRRCRPARQQPAAGAPPPLEALSGQLLELANILDFSADSPKFVPPGELRRGLAVSLMTAPTCRRTIS